MPRIFFMRFVFFLLAVFPAMLPAQYFTRDTSVRVYLGAQLLSNPWAGGHNCTQHSAIDLNFDGIKDLAVFENSGNSYYDKVVTYINRGTPNQVSYVHAPEYEKKFPYVHNWMLLVDYNCDGLEDIFTYNAGSFSVYRNISSNGNLLFTLQELSVQAVYQFNQNPQNLFVSPVDIPAFQDINNDGDLDVAAFDVAGIRIYYYENLSMERYGVCDSLDFREYSDCWGHIFGGASNNTITLNACSTDSTVMQPLQERHDLPQSLHNGNCLLCLDMDSDADMDMMTGAISYCNMNMLINGLDSSVAHMISQDTAFPSSDVPVNQLEFPCPYHVDVNNDGKRDLLVSPNSPGNALNKQSILWYRNSGTDASPVFNFQQTDFLQDGMIEVGEGAYPVFFDLDADGLKDLIIGNHSERTSTNCTGTQVSSLTAYRNIGTATAPRFQYFMSDYASLSTSLPGLFSLAPAFGDLDDDGDLDMVVGDHAGNLHWFRNTAGPSNPAAFSLVMPFDMVDDNNAPINVGQFSMPQIFDMDQDSLPDLVIGERTGRLYYYRNTGTPTAPVFTFMNAFLGNVDVHIPCCSGNAAPFIFMDNGNIEMYVGSERGYLFHYTNISGNLNGTFTKSDSLFWQPNEVWHGMQTAPALADITSDGLIDMAVGNYRGGITYYKGDFPSALNGYAGELQVTVYPNPVSDALYIHAAGVNGPVHVQLFDIAGRAVTAVQTSGQAPFKLDVKSLSPGTYFCRVTSGNGTAIKRVLIAR
jgi:hypothetical protein